MQYHPRSIASAMLNILFLLFPLPHPANNGKDNIRGILFITDNTPEADM